MKKQLNSHGIMNELKQGSRFFAAEEVPQSTTAITPDQEMPIGKLHPAINLAVDQSADQSTEQSTNQLTGQSTRQSPNQSTSVPTALPLNHPLDRSPVLGRPKAFYITEQQDRDLAIAVAKLSQRVSDKVGQKIDRSTVLRLLLEGADLTNDHTADRLVNQLVSRLISQLTG